MITLYFIGRSLLGIVGKLGRSGNVGSRAMTVHSFNTPEEMIEYVTDNQQRADNLIQDWQWQAKGGDYFIRAFIAERYCVTIYNQVIDPGYEDDRERLRRANCVLVRAFSDACPDGEMGSCHLSQIAMVCDESTFTWGRDMGWPPLFTIENRSVVPSIILKSFIASGAKIWRSYDFSAP